MFRDMGCGRNCEVEKDMMVDVVRPLPSPHNNSSVLQRNVLKKKVLIVRGPWEVDETTESHRVFVLADTEV